MRTRRDVIQRTAERMGLTRPGIALEGNPWRMMDDALADLLLELDEEQALDFDPTDADAIPEERMAQLVTIFRHSIIAETFDKVVDPTGQLYDRAKYRMFAAILGDSDYIEDQPADY